MGDVALTVPVIQAAAREYPNEKWVVLTRKSFQPFFAGIPNLTFFEPELYGRHKGLTGLLRLTQEIRQKHKVSSVIDLHNVLRSMIIRTFLKWQGCSVAFINKGRKEKKRLVSEKRRELKPLKHTTERYADVFAKAGLPLQTVSDFQPASMHFPFTEKLRALTGEKQGYWIGVAPFAKHSQKKYPLQMMKNVLEGLNIQEATIFLFGGGKEEEVEGKELMEGNPNVYSVIGQLDMKEELALMSVCDLMLTMDSGNMHLARLVGTPVVSIWGGTHPYAGFSPFGQEKKPELQIQTTMPLECRPCSVFGNKPCSRGDWACLTSIKPKTVVKVIESELGH